MEKKEFKGELKHIEANRLIEEDKNNSLDDFFLILAVIYNDLKGLVIFEKLIIDNYRPPELGEKTVHSGEYMGLLTQTRKLLISCINEFFKFLKEKKEVLDTYEFKDILNKTNKTISKKWNDIVSVAINKKTKNTSDFIEYLIKVRDNVSAHYYQSEKELRKSFRRFFFNRDKFEYNDLAYYSFGNTMEEIRFFYADATIQEYFRSTSNEKVVNLNLKFAEEIRGVIANMNITVARLLKAYIKSRPK